MNSSIIIVVFICEFIGLAIFAGIEKNWPQVLYGLGGAILNIGVLLMGATK